MTETIWTNCYDDSWQGQIVPESFAHPAKMSYGLLIRIIQHIKQNDWAKKGSVILDPFGGIGSTAILGAYNDYRVICVELEQKFVDLAKENFKLHENKWHKLGCPQPVMIQGDSRQLCQIIEKADLIVSSPPYLEKLAGGGDAIQPRPGDIRKSKRVMTHDENYGQTPGQLGCMKPGKIDAIVSSPPYAESIKGDGTQNETASESKAKRKTPGGSLGQSQRTQGYGGKKNLGNLKPGDIDLVLSSPPYADAVSEKHGGKDPNPEMAGGSAKISLGYSKNEKNLGNLKAGNIEVILSSPPYEKQQKGGGIQKSLAGLSNYPVKDGLARSKKAGRSAQGFGYHNQGETSGQLGQEQGETFWQAAKQIVEQCYQILRPGGHAIWVVKDFIRNKKRVDFTGDWERLCNSVGFKTVCKHKALLVKEDIKQSLFGHKIVNRKERKSFFRRLAESKGSPKIDWEMVICMRSA